MSGNGLPSTDRAAAAAQSAANRAVGGPVGVRDSRRRARTAPRVAGFDPMSEIGTSGLRQYGGFVLEEWLPQLSGRRAAWAYREMIDNSAVVGAILFAIEMLARKVEWRVEGSSERMPNGMLATEFAESCLHDLEATWPDTVSEILSFLPYGWCLPAGDEVLNGHGHPVAIEELTVGDHVLSGHGVSRRVNRTFSRPFDSEIVSVQLLGYHRPIRLTPEHRLPTDRGWLSAGDLRVGDRLRRPRMTLADGGDYLSGWLVGLYLAEGHCDHVPRTRVHFSLHVKEAAHVASQISAWAAMRSLTPHHHRATCEPQILRRDSSANVAFSHPVFRQLIDEWVDGDRAKTKALTHLPVDRDTAQGIWDGWVYGDAGFTTSFCLGHQMSIIAAALGLSSPMHKRQYDGVTPSGSRSRGTAVQLGTRPTKRHHMWPVTRIKRTMALEQQARSMREAGLSYEDIGVTLGVTTQSAWNWVNKNGCYVGERVRVSHYRQCHVEDDAVWHPITAVRREHYKGTVHDIEVEEDHTFCAGVFAVSNCITEEVFKRSVGRVSPAPVPDGSYGVVGLGVPETEEPQFPAFPASSEYTDGLVRWRKLAIRAQETLLRWRFRGYSDAVAMEQIDWHGGLHVVPLAKCMLFRTKSLRSSPESRSILRNAYESWYMLKNIQGVEAIGIERELAGLPKVTGPEGVDIYSKQYETVLNLVKDMVQSVRRDENEGIILPHGWEFELVTTGGARQIDTDKVVRRYRQDIAMSVLADFVIVGLDAVGSYAMVDIKSDIFGVAVDSALDIVSDQVTRTGFPRLFALNGVELKEPLHLNHSSAGRLDLEKVGRFLQDLAFAEAPIPWSKAMLAQMFGEAGLPVNFSGETVTQPDIIGGEEGSTEPPGEVLDMGDGPVGPRRPPAGRHAPSRGQPVSKADTKRGAMVALYPPAEHAERLALPAGEKPEDLHVTLAYLGHAEDLRDPQGLEDVVRAFAKTTPPIRGRITGHGHFTGGDEPVTYASVDGPHLSDARARLADHLERAGQPLSREHGFTPHVTLDYKVRHDLREPLNPVPFTKVSLVRGGDRVDFPLTGVRKRQEPDGDGVIDMVQPLADRRGPLTVQLERDIQMALAQLGEQAAEAYHRTVQKGVVEDARKMAAAVVRNLNLKAWVDRVLRPILRNHSARVAGDTQRLIQAEVDAEAVIGEREIRQMERQAGSHLRVADIRPAVRAAIEQAIAEGLQRGDNPEQTARRIRDMVPAGRMVHAGPQARARLIARQETLSQQREATLHAYEAAPSISAVRVRDGIFGPPRSDEACIDRSGEVIPIDEAKALAPALHISCSVSYDPVIG